MTDATAFARLRAAGFKGAAKRIEDTDLPRIGALIGVGEDELHAIIDVESAGSGFDALGRPKILFEPHVFYRHLGAGAKRDRAVSLGLAYASWGQKPYPKDSYPRLLQALLIDETAALKSASWGMTQILGENFKECGYASPQEMVAAFCEDEDQHLQATILLIKAKGLAGALKAHDWAKVARGWNGPGYAKNKYDIKLRDRFAFWKKIPDTPYNPHAPARQRDPMAAITAPTPAPAPVPAPAPAPGGGLMAAFLSLFTKKA
ncbi:N-acetylmuramidase family protein [uncultured Methylobacterium sp.]|jgi:hypothetical protein|uniref:N-acetylmuramidase family protein n=1 Tax=uncultured Methylobacterium sp. TaxID=157278 RepID=UPI00261F88F5|nr:N-acetylmuramidase family protein [uncultured Methylobacterium sp.]